MVNLSSKIEISVSARDKQGTSIEIKPRFMIKVPCRNGRIDHSGKCRKFAFWGQ